MLPKIKPTAKIANDIPVSSGEIARLVNRAVANRDDPEQKCLAAILAIVARMLLIQDDTQRQKLLDGLSTNMLARIGPLLLNAEPPGKGGT